MNLCPIIYIINLSDSGFFVINSSREMLVYRVINTQCMTKIWRACYICVKLPELSSEQVVQMNDSSRNMTLTWNKERNHLPSELREYNANVISPAKRYGNCPASYRYECLRACVSLLCYICLITMQLNNDTMMSFDDIIFWLTWVIVRHFVVVFYI